MDRVQRVVVNGKCSSWTPVSSGTPEGSIISPLLFACFINDLPAAVQSNCLMYADDVKIYHRIKCSADCDFLQKQLDAICHWSRLWGLSLNPSKCKVLTLSLRRAPLLSMYRLAGETLERVREMRDLGVILDEKLTFNSQVDRMGVRPIEHLDYSSDRSKQESMADLFTVVTAKLSLVHIAPTSVRFSSMAALYGVGQRTLTSNVWSACSLNS